MEKNGIKCSVCKVREPMVMGEAFYWCEDCWCEALDVLEAVIKEHGWQEVKRRIENG